MTAALQAEVDPLSNPSQKTQVPSSATAVVSLAALLAPTGSVWSGLSSSS